MDGIVVNPYTKVSTRVEIMEVASLVDNRVYLVNKREFDGGKVYLHVFDETTRRRTSEMVHRSGLARFVRTRPVVEYVAAA